jgi:CubicO group peptidase (beta-lactamase class C family)
MKVYKYIGLIFITLIQTASAKDNLSFKDWRDTVIKSNFSGVILVASENKVLFKEAFGLANREEKIPFSNDSIFDIGSLTKQFTATAILKLQESNKLSVNDPLSKFFDNVPDDKKKITVHHLLTHTAGFIANRGGGTISNLYDVVTKTEIIIEKITEGKYETFYYENIFEPAGLTDTGYRLPKRAANRVAINYGADQTVYQRLFSIEAKSLSVGNPFQHLKLKEGPRFNIEGAGGMSSTAGDLFRWYMALNSNLILSDKSKNQLFLPHNESLDKKSKSHYGYGWDIKSTDRGTLHAQHNGSNGYSFADMHYFVDENIFIVLATNDRDVYPQVVMDELLLLVGPDMANKKINKD